MQNFTTVFVTDQYANVDLVILIFPSAFLSQTLPDRSRSLSKQGTARQTRVTGLEGHVYRLDHLQSEMPHGRNKEVK